MSSTDTIFLFQFQVNSFFERYLCFHFRHSKLYQSHLRVYQLVLLFFPFDKSFLSSHTASSLLPPNSTYFRRFSASNKYKFGAKSFSYSCSARSVRFLNTVKNCLSTQDSQVICKHNAYFINTHYPPRLTKGQLTYRNILTLIQ